MAKLTDRQRAEAENVRNQMFGIVTSAFPSSSNFAFQLKLDIRDRPVEQIWEQHAKGGFNPTIYERKLASLLEQVTTGSTDLGQQVRGLLGYQNSQDARADIYGDSMSFESKRVAKQSPINRQLEEMRLREIQKAGDEAFKSDTSFGSEGGKLAYETLEDPNASGLEKFSAAVKSAAGTSLAPASALMGELGNMFSGGQPGDRSLEEVVREGQQSAEEALEIPSLGMARNVPMARAGDALTIERRLPKDAGAMRRFGSGIMEALFPTTLPQNVMDDLPGFLQWMARIGAGTGQALPDAMIPDAIQTQSHIDRLADTSRGVSNAARMINRAGTVEDLASARSVLGSLDTRIPSAVEGAAEGAAGATATNLGLETGLQLAQDLGAFGDDVDTGESIAESLLGTSVGGAVLGGGGGALRGRRLRGMYADNGLRYGDLDFHKQLLDMAAESKADQIQTRENVSRFQRDQMTMPQALPPHVPPPTEPVKRMLVFGPEENVVREPQQTIAPEPPGQIDLAPLDVFKARSNLSSFSKLTFDQKMQLLEDVVSRREFEQTPDTGIFRNRLERLKKAQNKFTRDPRSAATSSKDLDKIANNIARDLGAAGSPLDAPVTRSDVNFDLARNEPGRIETIDEMSKRAGLTSVEDQAVRDMLNKEIRQDRAMLDLLERLKERDSSLSDAPGVLEDGFWRSELDRMIKRVSDKEAELTEFFGLPKKRPVDVDVFMRRHRNSVDSLSKNADNVVIEPDKDFVRDLLDEPVIEVNTGSIDLPVWYTKLPVLDNPGRAEVKKIDTMRKIENLGASFTGVSFKDLGFTKAEYDRMIKDIGDGNNFEGYVLGDKHYDPYSHWLFGEDGEVDPKFAKNRANLKTRQILSEFAGDMWLTTGLRSIRNKNGKVGKAFAAKAIASASDHRLLKQEETFLASKIFHDLAKDSPEDFKNFSDFIRRYKTGGLPWSKMNTAQKRALFYYKRLYFTARVYQSALGGYRRIPGTGKFELAPSPRPEDLTTYQRVNEEGRAALRRLEEGEEHIWVDEIIRANEERWEKFSDSKKKEMALDMALEQVSKMGHRGGTGVSPIMYRRTGQLPDKWLQKDAKSLVLDMIDPITKQIAQMKHFGPNYEVVYRMGEATRQRGDISLPWESPLDTVPVPFGDGRFRLNNFTFDALKTLGVMRHRFDLHDWVAGINRPFSSVIRAKREADQFINATILLQAVWQLNISEGAIKRGFVMDNPVRGYAGYIPETVIAQHWNPVLKKIMPTSDDIEYRRATEIGVNEGRLLDMFAEYNEQDLLDNSKALINGIQKTADSIKSKASVPFRASQATLVDATLAQSGVSYAKRLLKELRSNGIRSKDILDLDFSDMLDGAAKDVDGLWSKKTVQHAQDIARFVSLVDDPAKALDTGKLTQRDLRRAADRAQAEVLVMGREDLPAYWQSSPAAKAANTFASFTVKWWDTVGAAYRREVSRNMKAAEDKDAAKWSTTPMYTLEKGGKIAKGRPAVQIAGMLALTGAYCGVTSVPIRDMISGFTTPEEEWDALKQNAFREGVRKWVRGVNLCVGFGPMGGMLMNMKYSGTGEDFIVKTMAGPFYTPATEFVYDATTRGGSAILNLDESPEKAQEYVLWGLRRGLSGVGGGYAARRYLPGKSVFQDVDIFEPEQRFPTDDQFDELQDLLDEMGKAK